MKPHFSANGVEIYHGDCREVLRALPDESVHCVVTSPPYWGLRDYGTGQWEGGSAECDHQEPVSLRRDSPGGFHNSTSRGTQPATIAVAKQYTSQCGKCGATRIDRQIGLEDSPVKYISTMREVFAEVRRVLRSDGTLWLNMGDSYCGASSEHKDVGSFGKNSCISKKTQTGVPMNGRGERTRAMSSGGLKPKDLVGIPWALATALRDPHYAGRIKSELDRVWLAAMIDAEGCMFIHKRKEGQHNGQGYFRQNASYGSGLEVANCSEAVVLRCQQITGIGSICTQGPEQNGRRKQKIYRWNVRTNECRWILEEVYPYLVAKQQQARLAIACPSSGEKAEAAHAALIGLHNGLSSEVDFPAPQSLYQPGWWLRQDIIWSKANPMPESVTDRCTKAHEYMFLLSKSERYYYNQEAVLEDVSPNTHARLSQDVQNQIGSDRVPGKTNGNMKAVGRRDGIDRGDDPRGRKIKCAEPGNGIKNNHSFDAAMAIMPDKRNRRSVWEVTTQPFPEAHFATFPEDLIKPCILAGCVEGGTVLDPFMGSGTTGLVARKLHCKAIGIELNEEYIEIASRRLSQEVFNFAQ